MKCIDLHFIGQFIHILPCTRTIHCVLLQNKLWHVCELTIHLYVNFKGMYICYISLVYHGIYIKYLSKCFIMWLLFCLEYCIVPELEYGIVLRSSGKTFLRPTRRVHHDKEVSGTHKVRKHVIYTEYTTWLRIDKQGMYIKHVATRKFYKLMLRRIIQNLYNIKLCSTCLRWKCVYL